MQLGMKFWDGMDGARFRPPPLPTAEKISAKAGLRKDGKLPLPPYKGFIRQAMLPIALSKADRAHLSRLLPPELSLQPVYGADLLMVTNNIKHDKGDIHYTHSGYTLPVVHRASGVKGMWFINLHENSKVGKDAGEDIFGYKKDYVPIGFKADDGGVAVNVKGPGGNPLLQFTARRLGGLGAEFAGSFARSAGPGMLTDLRHVFTLKDGKLHIHDFGPVGNKPISEFFPLQLETFNPAYAKDTLGLDVRPSNVQMPYFMGTKGQLGAPEPFKAWLSRSRPRPELSRDEWRR